MRTVSAAQSFDGGPGADTMIGGAGWDGYLVDNAGDQVIENPGEGSDTVYSLIGIFLPANVENLTLIGGADTIGYGNGLANTLTGNYTSNWLDGEGGADTMIGGLGNDAYVVDNPGDQV